MEKYINEDGMYTISIEPGENTIHLAMYGYFQGTDRVMSRGEVSNLVEYLKSWLNNSWGK